MRTGLLKKTVVALGLTLGAATATYAGTIEKYSVRDWDIFAYNDDSTKDFSHCAMAASYKNGVTLIFFIDKDKKWYMGLANSKWTLTPGSQYSFSVNLDGAVGSNWQGVAATTNTLRVPLPGSTTLFEQFSRSNLLTVTAPYGTFRFELSNSRAALDAVAACTARHIAAEPPPANPFERRPTAPQSAGVSEAFYSEGAIVMTNMLSTIGSTGHKLLPVDTLREKFAGDHAVWISATAAGSLRILPKAASADSLSAEVIGLSAQQCKNKFATGKTGAGPQIVKIAVLCQDAEMKTQNYHFIILPRTTGGFYLFSVYALNETSESTSTAAQVGDLIMASQKK